MQQPPRWSTAARWQALCCTLMASLFGARAGAASSATFADALSVALSAPEVARGGTVFGEPLVTRGNSLEALHPRTPAVIDALCRHILKARHEVLLQTYEYTDDDEAATRVLDAIRQRLHRALEGPASASPLVVRLLTNQSWVGENRLSQAALVATIREFAAEPRAAGRIFMDWATYRGSPLAILHTKTAVFDRAHAMVMTGNLYTHGGLQEDSVNMAAHVSGPVVGGLRADWLGARGLSRRQAGTGPEPPPAAFAAQQLPRPRDGGQVAAILSRPSNWTYWGAGECNPQAQGLLALIDTATSSIDVLNPSLAVPRLHQALVRAIAERGVTVRVLISPEMNRWREQRFFGGDGYQQADKLRRAVRLAGGQRASERLHIRFASLDGRNVNAPTSPGNVHAKVASFDETCLLIGSTNWNWLSWNNGRELSVAMVAPEAAADFSRHSFAELFARGVPQEE